MKNEDLGIFSITDNEIKIAYGKSLRQLREHLNITQVELSRVINVPRQSLSVYELGRNLPTIAHAYRIARFFRCSVDDFIIYGLEKQYELLEENFRSITDKYDAIEKE